MNGGEVSCRDGGDRGCPSSRVSRCAQLDGRNAGEASTLQEAGQGEAEAGSPAALLAASSLRPAHTAHARERRVARSDVRDGSGGRLSVPSSLSDMRHACRSKTDVTRVACL